MRIAGINAKVFSQWKMPVLVASLGLACACFAVVGAEEPQADQPAVQGTGNNSRQRAAQKQADKAETKAANQEANQEAKAAQQALNAPTLLRLAEMSPEERAAALAKVRPEVRKRLEERLEYFSKLEPERRAMVLNQLDKLDALPPDRREEVRASLAEYNAITAPRKGLIMLEMRIMAPMTDQQRANYMSRPLFRRRFSEAEIRMMSDLHGIVP